MERQEEEPQAQYIDLTVSVDYITEQQQPRIYARQGSQAFTTTTTTSAVARATSGTSGRVEGKGNARIDIQGQHVQVQVGQYWSVSIHTIFVALSCIGHGMQDLLTFHSRILTPPAPLPPPLPSLENRITITSYFATNDTISSNLSTQHWNKRKRIHDSFPTSQLAAFGRPPRPGQAIRSGSRIR